MSNIKVVKDSLNQAFRIKDLRQLQYFLGLEISRSQNGIPVCQRKYYLDILSNTRMMGAKPSSTPIKRDTKILLNKIIMIMIYKVIGGWWDISSS